MSASSSFLRFIRSLRASASRRAIWMRCWMLSAFMSAIIIVMTGAREAGEAEGLGTNGRGAKRSGEEKFGDGDGQGEKLEEEALAGMGKGRRRVKGRGGGSQAGRQAGRHEQTELRQTLGQAGRQAQCGIDDDNEARANWATSSSTVGKSRAEQSSRAERELTVGFRNGGQRGWGPEGYMLQVQTHSVLGCRYRIHAEPGAASQSPIPRSRPRGRTDRYRPGGWLAQGTTAKQRLQYLHLRDSYSL